MVASTGLFVALVGVTALSVGAAQAGSQKSSRPSIDQQRDMIAKEARAQGVPVALANSVVRVESNYNPAAMNGPYVGLMQISFATARSLGYSGSVAGLRDPATNIRYGMRYLAEAHRRAKGDICGTIAKYQGGVGSAGISAAARVYCSKVNVHLATAAPSIPASPVMTASADFVRR